MTMRKKDYEAIAACIRETVSPASAPDTGIISVREHICINNTLQELAGRVSRYCATQDPTFKRDRFLADCGVSHD